MMHQEVTLFLLTSGCASDMLVWSTNLSGVLFGNETGTSFAHATRLSINILKSLFGAKSSFETQGLLDRCDIFGQATFSGESLLQELKNPWELTLTEPVPEVVEFCPADWAQIKIFLSPISEEI